MNRYDEYQFQAKIEAALARVRTILDNTRNPRSPTDVPHRYEDKYLLAEFVGSVAIAYPRNSEKRGHRLPTLAACRSHGKRRARTAHERTLAIHEQAEPWRPSRDRRKRLPFEGDSDPFAVLARTPLEAFLDPKVKWHIGCNVSCSELAAPRPPTSKEGAP